MPTAAKLFAAAAFALVAFFAAETFKPAMPPDTQWGLFSPLNAVLGLICGWSIAGWRAGRGYKASAGTGLRTSATIVFWALLGFSIYEMIQRSLRRQYDGIVEALQGVFALILEHGTLLASQPQSLIVLVVGGILGGWAAEWAARRWR